MGLIGMTDWESVQETGTLDLFPDLAHLGNCFLYSSRGLEAYFESKGILLLGNPIHLSVKAQPEIMGMKWKSEMLESQFISPVRREFLTGEIN